MPSKSSLKTKETEERKICTMHAFSRLKMQKRQRFLLTKFKESLTWPDLERKNSLVHSINMMQRLLRLKQLLKKLTKKLII